MAYENKHQIVILINLKSLKQTNLYRSSKSDFHETYMLRICHRRKQNCHLNKLYGAKIQNNYGALIHLHK